jgi:hypothetical protein
MSNTNQQPSTTNIPQQHTDEKTITGMITRLEPNEVFVFGSNLGGRHGAGAARLAREWGAIWGQATGIQGRTYAIPTVDNSVRNTLSLDEIRTYANEFIQYAREHPNLIFLLTDVGCGLAGLRAEEVAPLFQEALTIPNIRIHHKFMTVLCLR